MAPVLMICLTWFGLLGWGGARGTNWNRYKPAGWLLREGRGHDMAARDAALVELTSRFRAGRLSRGDGDALLDMALDIQGDRWRPWTDAVGDVLAAARDAKRFPAEKWERYVRQVRAPQLKVGPVYRRGDALILTVSEPTARLAPGDAQDAEVPAVRLLVGDANIDLSDGLWRLQPALARLPYGQHTVRATVHWTLRHTAPKGRRTLVDESVELSAPLTIVPTPAGTAKLNSDPALRETVEQSLTVTELSIGPAPPRGQGTQLSLRVRAVDPPVWMAFRAILRSGTKEWEIGGLRFPPGHTSTCAAAADLDQLRGFDATRVDVVLRPSAAEARGSVYEIWGGEVVIRNVVVARPPKGVRGE
jgi:hypothetical protein